MELVQKVRDLVARVRRAVAEPANAVVKVEDDKPNPDKDSWEELMREIQASADRNWPKSH